MSMFPPRHIYFVKPIGADGPVKIGFSNNVARRVEQLLECSPVDLEVIATCPGSYNIENRIHRMLFASHWRREWFWVTPELTRLIASINDGTFNPDDLPEDARPLWYEKHCELARRPRKKREPSIAIAEAIERETAGRVTIPELARPTEQARDAA